MIRFPKLLFLLLVFAPLLSIGQCKSFTKRNCNPLLESYIINGSYNSSVLTPGDKAEALLTFYAGQEYRLVVCAHPILGDVELQLLNTDNELLLTHKINETAKSFDFQVASTQNLLAKVTVPEMEVINNLVHEGCVTIMVGFKE